MKFEDGNRIGLLCGGAEYFPALLKAVAQAKDEIYFETYIYQDDETGRRVTDALVDAAQRKVKVRLTVDGFGSANFVGPLRDSLEAAGVEVIVFRPEHRWWQYGLKFFSRDRLRRLHRKLVLIDRTIAFCGGINVLDDLNDPRHGPLEAPRFDFAARIEGPLVASIAAHMLNQWLRLDWRTIASERGALQRAIDTWSSRRPDTPPHPSGDDIRAAFVTRDNLRNRRAIERAYLVAIKVARADIILCNAYYFPGRKFRKSLIAAAARGVRVRLLLQGRPEYPVQHYASQALYAELLEAGIEIHEYKRSFLHAKVGVIDRAWSTIGSSNIDPFSLLLAREANVVVRNQGFSEGLRAQLEAAITHDAVPVLAERLVRRGIGGRLLNSLSYATLRLGVYFTGHASQY